LALPGLGIILQAVPLKCRIILNCWPLVEELEKKPTAYVLAQRELEKRRSPLVQRFRPFGTGIFRGIGGLSSDDSGAARCQPRESHEPQWSLQNRAIFRFLPVVAFSSDKFGARTAAERRSPTR
jgi:hypothetical protein